MKQLMLDVIHPVANDILLFINRGEPRDEKEWAAVRRGAATLAESIDASCTTCHKQYRPNVFFKD